MGNYTIFQMFENPRKGRQARNFAKNVQKTLDLKSSSEQLFSENCRQVPLQIVYMKNCNLRSRGLVRNLYNFSPAKRSPCHEYSRTSLYGHPLKTNTSFNTQISSSLGKCPDIFSKFNPLNTRGGGVLPRILDRGVPRRFVDPNPI